MAFPTYMESARLFFDPSCQGNFLFPGGSNSVCPGRRPFLRMEEASKMRPFFSFSEEYYDEGYYDEQSPENKRRLIPEQVYLLEKSFEAESKLEPERKNQLAKELGLRPRQVAVWFQNRRARLKTKLLEKDCSQLKSSYDSLVSDYDRIIKENEKLKAEVFLLTQKLQAKETVWPGMLALDEKPDQHSANAAGRVGFADPQSNVKVEDHLSTGSAGSSVVDEDGRQVLDSGDSYFPDDVYPAGCAVMVDGFQSKENDGGDDGHFLLSNAILAVAQQHHEEGEPLSWWNWS